MRRRLRFCLPPWLWLAAALLPVTGPAAERPNFLVILVDDLGPEWIGCYGGEDTATPAIDRLAAHGLKFRNFYSMPKCTPTRVSLLTGQYPFRHGWVNHWDVPRWGSGCHFDGRHYPTFARRLRAAGYRTAIAGKWQINDFRVQPAALREHGFDAWCMWTGFEAGNPPSAERYHDPYLFTADGSRTRPGRFGPDLFAEFLVDFVARHRDEPMLLYYPMVLTHPPLVPTPDAPEAATPMERHRAMVAYADQLVGRLVDALDRLALRRDTYVLFTTDNGTSQGITGRMAGRPVSGGKGTLGENGVRQPLIVSRPGRIPPGTETDALADITDLYPTLLELAGIPLPAADGVDGRSFARVLADPADPGRRDWILAMGGEEAAFRRDRVVPLRPYAPRVLRNREYKLWVDASGRPEKLFHLPTDPAEEHNLWGTADPAATAAGRKLARVLATFPAQDAVPRYEPVPPQSWDRHPWSGQ